MAKRVQVTLLSDLTGEDITDGGESIPFSFLGVDYEIDLSPDQALTMTDALKPYIRAARTAPKKGGKGGKNKGGNVTSLKSHKTKAGDIRAWARDNGRDVGERGRIPKQVREDYYAAHIGQAAVKASSRASG